jgi:hypothetical protein
MLRSKGAKDETILYHIKYYTFLGYLTINGVTCYGQPKCWLIDIGLVTKLACIWVWAIPTQPCAIVSIFKSCIRGYLSVVNY